MTDRGNTPLIFSGSDALTELSGWLGSIDRQQIVVLCDGNTAVHCLPQFRKQCPVVASARVVTVAAGEQSKSLETAASVWRDLLTSHADRSAIIVNLGGGMVTDLGGFVASLYKRGIAFVHVPTTVLAMADACIGGKTGIDLDHHKNIVGTFSDPVAIALYPGWLASLPQSEYVSGFAEICKVALIADRSLWQSILNRVSPENDFSLIAQALRVKQLLVASDPYDNARRRALNFGHTVGHAIESHFLELGRPVLHGEAVASGMLVETLIARNKRLVTDSEADEIAAVLRRTLNPVSLVAIGPDELVKWIKNDKKNRSGKLLFALPDSIGRCRPDVEVSTGEIIDALSQCEKAE